MSERHDSGKAPSAAHFDGLPSGKKHRRQDGLVQLLERLGYASVEQMAELFDVTTQTVRRDISELAVAGRIRRYHGGAALSPAIDAVTYRQRRIDRIEAKRRIAVRVGQLVRDGSSIFLDAGTTCEAVAEVLAEKSNLKIVTYNLHAATLLSERSNFTIAIPAGFVRNVDGSVLGDGAVDFIRRFRFDAAIISVSGIEIDGRMADDDYNEVSLVRTAIGLSRSVILAADNSKFGQSGLVELCNLRDVSVLVTDAAPSAEIRAIIDDGAVDLQLC